jgi:hypothetical protein
MKRRRISATVAVVSALLMSLPAMGKGGPSQGIITGPGLVEPITLREPGSKTIGADLASMVQRSRFFSGVFDGDPERLKDRPAGDLGPQYTITYTMSLSDRRSGTIVQYAFPFAEPMPITYIPADQQYWANNETVGGWFVTHLGFRQTMISVGVPVPDAPVSIAGIDAATDLVPPNGGGVSPWLVVAAAVLAIALAAVLLRRRLARSRYAQI